jgi:hypothetical protein
MPVNFILDDDLANQLKPYENQMEEILALGIREWQARGQLGFHGVHSVLERLAGLPTPDEVLSLRPAPPLLERIESLLVKNSTSGWSADEQREWDQYQYVEHLVRLAKVTAVRKL